VQISGCPVLRGATPGWCRGAAGLLIRGAVADVGREVRDVHELSRAEGTCRCHGAGQVLKDEYGISVGVLKVGGSAPSGGGHRRGLPGVLLPNGSPEGLHPCGETGSEDVQAVELADSPFYKGWGGVGAGWQWQERSAAREQGAGWQREQGAG